MSTTLKFQSFAHSNIRERSELLSDVAAGDMQLELRSTEGFVVGDVIYVGEPGREGCERAVVATVDGSTALTLVSALALAHSSLSAVTAVLGDRIRIYRAVNVTDTPPELDVFSVLATRSIDPDQPDTYYTDSAGSSGYWYRHTYFNETTLAETPLDEFWPVRGDDFAHYASLELIRKEAGFQNAFNLSDVDVDMQRRAAESEINSRLGGYLTVPFKPVPEIIKTITIKLAAGFLIANAYQTDPEKEGRVKEARLMLMSLQDGTSATGDESNAVASGVSGDFGDEPRMFSVGDIY